MALLRFAGGEFHRRLDEGDAAVGGAGIITRRFHAAQDFDRTLVKLLAHSLTSPSMLSGNTKSNCLLSAGRRNVAVVTSLVSHRLAPQKRVSVQVGAGVKQ
jgi:hypothetical protein